MNRAERQMVSDIGFTIITEAEKGYKMRFEKDGVVFWAAIPFKPLDMSWPCYVVWLYGSACRVTDEDDGK